MPTARSVVRAVSLLGLTGAGVAGYLWLTKADDAAKPRRGRQRATAVRVIEAAAVSAVPRATGYGEVAAARQWQALAEVGGTVVEAGDAVQVGRVVRKGTVLFRIDPTEAELEKRRSLATVEGVKAQLAELKAREKSAKKSLAVEKEALKMAEEALERTKGLYRTGTVPRSDVEAEEAARLSAKKAVVSLENTITELPASRRVLNAQLTEVEAGVTGSELVLSRTAIVAPFTMQLSEVSATTGQTVSSGQVLAIGESLDVLEVSAQFPLGHLDPLIPRRAPRMGPRRPSDAAGTTDPAPTDPAPEPDPAQPTGPDDPATDFPPSDATADRPRQGGYLARIAESLDATVTLDISEVEHQWPARFSRFLGVDAATRTTGVVVEIDRELRRQGSASTRLSAGMHVSVELRGEAREDCLAIPLSALHDGLIYVVDESERLRLREVEIDWTQEEFACVATGLEAGEQIVVSEVLPAVDGMSVSAKVDRFETQRLVDLTAGPAGAS